MDEIPSYLCLLLSADDDLDRHDLLTLTLIESGLASKVD
jgi:hypothetical protein